MQCFRPSTVGLCSSLVGLCLVGLSFGEARAACAGGLNFFGPFDFLVAGPAEGAGLGKYRSGVLFFDGRCGITASNLNGGINGIVSNSKATGTYTTNPDNTVTITLTPAGQTQVQTYSLGISHTASEAVGIETDGTTVATIDIMAQNRPFSYFQKTLSSTYSAVRSGQPGGYSDLNYVTFDGRGHLSGVDVFNDGGNQGDQPYSGQYQVNSDGTFSGALNGNYNIFSLTGVIDNSTTEIEYTYSLAGLGEVVSCVGKK